MFGRQDKDQQLYSDTTLRKPNGKMYRIRNRNKNYKVNTIKVKTIKICCIRKQTNERYRLLPRIFSWKNKKDKNIF
jgi:hypothetical protein